jgi:chemotaxis-related protein WspD
MELPVLPLTPEDYWNRIGVRGDHSCPRLAEVIHCHNCPVFAAAGRHFLNAPIPTGYLEDWAERLALPAEQAAADLRSLLIFRLGEEWLALAVPVLVEVTPLRPIHRIPYRGGLLAGLVNIRGELLLCVHLAALLGITDRPADNRNGSDPDSKRMLVVSRQGERWVFPADEVVRVHRLPGHLLTPPPATVARARARLTHAVFSWRERSIGCLDEARLFQALRETLL